MKIAIVGAGGAGGYFGGRWAEAGMDVTLVARGAHLEAIQKSGIRIESPLGDLAVPVRAVADPADVGPVDLLIFATKSWQLQAAASSFASKVDYSTAVVGIQNGVDSTDVLASSFDPAAVLGGTCRIISYVAEPGLIRHVGIEPSIFIGETHGGESTRTSAIEQALHLGVKLGVIASESIRAEIWKKFLFFAPVSGIGSVTRSPIGVFRNEPETRSLLMAAIEEVSSVAVASGVELPPGITDKMLAFIDTMPAAGTSSMQRDFEAGTRTELEALAGAVVRIGKRTEIATPVHNFIYSVLLPCERRARNELVW